MRRIATDCCGNHGIDSEPSFRPWQAHLSLGFTDDAGTTRLAERRHIGPLRVQKPLYPEGSGVCHAVVVHPPGGVVGGDELTINAVAGARSHALITTPGAAKWYKANGRISRQDVLFEIGPGATLEWLPQETIFFNAAQVWLNHSVSLTGDAAYLGCDILCFGRTASGEAFEHGRIEQRTDIRRDGRLIWFEQGALAGDGSAMRSPLALGGRTVCATLIAVGKALPSDVISAIREEAASAVSSTELFGVTQMKSMLVARYLGNSSEAARQAMMRVWHQLRPALLGRAAAMPRIWNT